MAKRVGTATEFLITALQAYPDRELQISELHDLASGRFTKMNLREALLRLQSKDLVTKVNDQDRSVWWAITARGVRA